MMFRSSVLNRRCANAFFASNGPSPRNSRRTLSASPESPPRSVSCTSSISPRGALIFFVGRSATRRSRRSSSSMSRVPPRPLNCFCSIFVLRSSRP
ncbi:hypothetical protein DIPPA_30054 [Diplonema papillatum]|nr:hypothetical protein DIPPA_30054 [Diplonema papillatum]